MIKTREDLISALQEAAELEHGLMIQYLFPALTMKKRLDEGLSGPQQRLTRAWEATILRVAVEEMGHLATVCNLLSSIGAAPHFMRPNFPQPVGYYPFPFDLIPFGKEALNRMIVFELPKGESLPDGYLGNIGGPEGLAPEFEYKHVGDLYSIIRDGFRDLPEEQLFIGPVEAQIDDNWSVDLDVRQVVNRVTAIAAIDDIVLDGEGAAADRRGSHYARFLAIQAEYAEAGSFEAARNVVRNPQTLDSPDSLDGTAITEPLTLEVARLFNATYEIVLLLLTQYFTLDGLHTPRRDRLRSAGSRLMSVAIRPLSEVLTEMPATQGALSPNAGPPFELSAALTLSPFPEARWTLINERLIHLVHGATNVADDVPRVAGIGETVELVRRSLMGG